MPTATTATTAPIVAQRPRLRDDTNASFVGAFTKEYGRTASRGWHAQRARNTAGERMARGYASAALTRSSAVASAASPPFAARPTASASSSTNAR
jgi:hypothetical protein